MLADKLEKPRLAAKRTRFHMQNSQGRNLVAAQTKQAVLPVKESCVVQLTVRPTFQVAQLRLDSSASNRNVGSGSSPRRESFWPSQ